MTHRFLEREVLMASEPGTSKVRAEGHSITVEVKVRVQAIALPEPAGLLGCHPGTSRMRDARGHD
jgi:hypothetical protein